MTLDLSDLNESGWMGAIDIDFVLMVGTETSRNFITDSLFDVNGSFNWFKRFGFESFAHFLYLLLTGFVAFG